ncbi:hypothetical protein ABDD95_00855 [Mucilaginibacter sp. PAMB04274]
MSKGGFNSKLKYLLSCTVSILFTGKAGETIGLGGFVSVTGSE